MNIIKGLKGIGESIKSAYKRFTVPLILCAISGMLMIWLSEIGYDKNNLEETITKLVMVLMLGVPIALGLKLLWERLKEVRDTKIYLSYGLGVAFLVLYYFMMLKEFNMVSIVRYSAFSFVFYLVAACITCWRDKRNYEMYIIKIFSRFIITGIFALIMFLGIAGILASIDGLLDIDVSSKAYLYTFYVIAFLFVPSYAFAGIPVDSEELDDTVYPKSLSVLLLYIMIPIISAYTVILYLYFVKVLIQWKLPEGMVGNLVLWYSIVSIVVLFLVAPIMKEKKWVKSFTFWFTKLILPCIVMLFIAVGIRIKAYGVTESRYFVIIAGLWAMGIFVYWDIKGVKRNIILPVSLALVLLISVLGPLSAFEVSMRSQSSRLKSILESYGMLEGGTLNPADETISQEDRRNIRSILNYFNDSHSLEDVEWLPEGFDMQSTKEYFGFDVYEYYNDTYYFYFNSKTDGVADIRGYDYLVSFYGGGRNQQNIEYAEGGSMKYSANDYTIDFYRDNSKVYSFDVKDFAQRLYEEYGENKSDLEQSEMTVENENSYIRIKLEFKQISGQLNNSDGDLNLESVDCSVYIRMK